MKIRNGLVGLVMLVGGEIEAVEEPPAEDGAETEAPVSASALSVSLSTIVPTEYVAQGMVFEKEGVIVQPIGRLTLSVVEGLDVFVGYYASFHDEHTDAGLVNPPDAPKNMRSFYEADWFAGATLHHDRWSLTSFYAGYYSPSDAYETASSVDVILAFADKGILAERLAIDPYVNFFVETHNKSGTGIDEGYYLQVGAKPNHPAEVFGHEILVTAPVSTGLGWSDFYAEDELFGYLSVGLAPVVPLAPWIPVDYGRWSVTPAVQYYHLNEDVQYLTDRGDRVVPSLTVTLDF